MIVLKATQQQYKELNGFSNPPSRLEFVEDGDGNWIIGLEVLSDSAFDEIKDRISELEKIEYIPLPEKNQ